MASDLRSGKIYCMANGYGLVGRISSQALPVTSLIEVDGETGEVMTNRVQLSREIWLEAPSVFSGYGRCVIVQSVGSSGSYDIQRVYDIALPSGQVLDLGETWTFIGELNDMWGVAEFAGQQLSLVYGARAGLRRLDLPGSFGSHLVSFPNIYAVEHVAVSIPLNRLYVEAIRGGDGGPRVVGSSDFLFAPCITGPLETSGAASLEFEVRSPLDHNVTIEASTNLTTWTTFTNMANPSGTVRFKVPKNAFPKYFYRAKTQ
jgi:hypothetical protein